VAFNNLLHAAAAAVAHAGVSPTLAASDTGKDS